MYINFDGFFAPDNNSGVLAIGPFFEYWLLGDDMVLFVGVYIVLMVFFFDGFDV